MIKKWCDNNDKTIFSERLLILSLILRKFLIPIAFNNIDTTKQHRLAVIIWSKEKETVIELC